MPNRLARAYKLLDEMRTGLGATEISDRDLHRQSKQVEVLVRRLTRSAGCAQILRDPVGTGKTTVTLAAARLLLAEDRIDYLLVIAPNKTIAKQWLERSVPNFGVQEPSKRTDRWAKNRLIVGTHRVHPKRMSPCPARTLVIIDEAHRGLQDETAEAFLGTAEVARGAMTLLVTATPYQLTTTGFTTMLSIAGEAKSNEDETLKAYGSAVASLLRHWDPLQSPEAVSDLLAEAEKQRDRSESLLKRHLVPRTTVDAPSPPSLQLTVVPIGAWATAYTVARVVPELIGVGKNDAYQRGLASSSETLWSQEWAVGRKVRHLRALGDGDISEFFDNLQDGLGQGRDHPKVAATVSWVCNQAREGRNVVVFTAWLPSQRVLGEVLGTELEGVADVTAPATGQMIPGDLMSRFTSRPVGKPVVLVLSDRFSESIDLDGGLPSIVHHDLTWNPVRLTQRWGRVVRIRTGFEKVPADRIYIPVLDIEVESRLAKVVVGRRSMAGMMVPDSKKAESDAWTLPDEVLKRIALGFG